MRAGEPLRARVCAFRARVRVSGQPARGSLNLLSDSGGLLTAVVLPSGVHCLSIGMPDGMLFATRVGRAATYVFSSP